ncbi:hypothetical protein [Demetria terragena]|uniref:hypothetical protein n=1 Tax=Demetria terragena TaxID=63959 RepID=UPI00036749B9|nr:hypothetical protein [Demetria terragena]
MFSHHQGRIGLHVRGAHLTTSVQVRVDDQPIDVTTPSTLITVAPGRHVLEVNGLEGFLTTFGKARLDVYVAPRQHVDVFYAVPHTFISKARIGFVPVNRAWALDWRELALTCVATIGLLLLVGIVLTVWNTLTGG